jgi:hypothetical protein
MNDIPLPAFGARPDTHLHPADRARPARPLTRIVAGPDTVAFFTGKGEVMGNGKLDPDALHAFGKAWNVEFLAPPLAR